MTALLVFDADEGAAIRDDGGLKGPPLTGVDEAAAAPARGALFFADSGVSWKVLVKALLWRSYNKRTKIKDISNDGVG